MNLGIVRLGKEYFYQCDSGPVQCVECCSLCLLVCGSYKNAPNENSLKNTIPLYLAVAAELGVLEAGR